MQMLDSNGEEMAYLPELKLYVATHLLRSTPELATYLQGEKHGWVPYAVEPTSQQVCDIDPGFRRYLCFIGGGTSSMLTLSEYFHVLAYARRHRLESCLLMELHENLRASDLEVVYSLATGTEALLMDQELFQEDLRELCDYVNIFYMRGVRECRRLLG